MNHQAYLLRCLHLAQKALGNTYPNPLVGAVVVHDQKIIGEGWHHQAGQAHAEVNAINSVENKSLLKESCIYVSLEPCAHFGRTPPCAQRIIDEGIPKVVIGSLDPFAQVNGKGIAMLKEAGVQVELCLMPELMALNKRFFCFHTQKRPYIILKWAQSADGYIDAGTNNKGIYWISNSFAKQYVHQMRAQEQAILVGNATVLADNPSLTTRLVAGKNPMRIIVDPSGKIQPGDDLEVLNEEASSLIFNLHLNQKQGIHEWIKLNSHEDFLSQMLAVLYKLNIQSVIVEGGAKILQSFVDANLWDEALQIIAPQLQLVEGSKAPKMPIKACMSQNHGDNVFNFFKANEA